MNILLIIIIIYLKISSVSVSKKFDYDDLYPGKGFPYLSLIFFLILLLFFFFFKFELTFFTAVAFYLLFPLLLKKIALNFLRFYYWFYARSNKNKILASRLQMGRTKFKTVIFHMSFYSRSLFFISILIFIFNIKVYIFVTVLWHIIVIFFFKLCPLTMDIFVTKECSHFIIKLTETGEKKLMLYKKKLLNYNNYYFEFFLDEIDFVDYLKL